MSTNVAALIKAGVNAFQSGDKAKARQMLEQATEADPYSEMAWLWLSAVVTSKEEQQTCLTNVLVINPENDRARQGLKSLGIDPDSVLADDAEEEAEEETYADDDSGGGDFFDDVGEEDDYFVPSSSASVETGAEQATDDDYDDWVGGLGIGDSAPAAEPVAKSDDFFSDTDFSSDAGFDFGEDLFGEETYDDYGDEGYADDDYYVEDGYAEEGGYDDFYEAGDDLFEGSGGQGYVALDTMDDLYADISTLEEFEALVDADLDSYNRSEFEGDPFYVPPPEPEEPALPTPEELFAQIPSEIEPTRLPGSIEEPPGNAYAPIAVVGILNVLAIIFIVFQLIA